MRCRVLRVSVEDYLGGGGTFAGTDRVIHAAAHVGPAGAGQYDMGARRFGPDISKFLQQDVFYTALGNLGLGGVGGGRVSRAGGRRDESTSRRTTLVRRARAARAAVGGIDAGASFRCWVIRPAP